MCGSVYSASLKHIRQHRLWPYNAACIRPCPAYMYRSSTLRLPNRALVRCLRKVPAISWRIQTCSRLVLQLQSASAVYGAGWSKAACIVGNELEQVQSAGTRALPAMERCSEGRCCARTVSQVQRLVHKRAQSELKADSAMKQRALAGARRWEPAV